MKASISIPLFPFMTSFLLQFLFVLSILFIPLFRIRISTLFFFFFFFFYSSSSFSSSSSL
ncbi:hypothetical protein PICMEDRAFT_123438 [Pichia membranifaciens NRRL Y-2026]|uniref:Uncharacterized protein n=1 Tax=Pichia membranifaciens NRRL Y-2026 TaxID=763406 RepID=A0A1E3NPV0_9ASCO|nr:hypothetical protein PICMEDRAFT_123438 [Pichia membranifaciens NRRL Y-2026]ODQ48129.1 hypothetical protein PICMEDRAFT_123438 [Pichia membranifaciens NRRL Y-2026]